MKRRRALLDAAADYRRQANAGIEAKQIKPRWGVASPGRQDLALIAEFMTRDEIASILPEVAARSADELWTVPLEYSERNLTVRLRVEARMAEQELLKSLESRDPEPLQRYVATLRALLWLLNDLELLDLKPVPAANFGLSYINFVETLINTVSANYSQLGDAYGGEQRPDDAATAV